MKNKKKIIAGTALVAALAVGGTAAFFTSSDLITNVFNTGTTTDVNDPNAGIDVNEQFTGYIPGPDGILGTDDDILVEYDDNALSTGEVTVTLDGDNYVSESGAVYVPNANGTYTGPLGEKVVIGETVDRNGTPIFVVGPAEVLPGQSFVKEVGIDSEANYNQFVRAKVVVDYLETLPTSITVDETEITDPALIAAEAAKYVNVTYNTEATPSGTNGKWLGTVPATGVSSDWFYYSKVLGATPARTADLIKAVELDVDAPNWMKNVKFTVTVEGESIQATPDAWGPDAGWKQPAINMPTAVDND